MHVCWWWSALITLSSSLSQYLSGYLASYISSMYINLLIHTYNILLFKQFYDGKMTVLQYNDDSDHDVDHNNDMMLLYVYLCVVYHLSRWGVGGTTGAHNIIHEALLVLPWITSTPIKRICLHQFRVSVWKYHFNWVGEIMNTAASYSYRFSTVLLWCDCVWTCVCMCVTPIRTHTHARTHTHTRTKDTHIKHIICNYYSS